MLYDLTSCRRLRTQRPVPWDQLPDFSYSSIYGPGAQLYGPASRMIGSTPPW